jgi:transglutaminase-like putative cysteine protease
VLAILAGLSARGVPRAVVPAAVALALAGVAASTSAAVAKGALVGWQRWDFYNASQPPVSVSFVWNAQYGGIRWPRKETTVLEVKAPPRSLFWRAAVLDEFTGSRWVEEPSPLRGDALEPKGAEELRQDVRVLALADTRLVGASVPVRFDAGDAPLVSRAPGFAELPSGLTHGFTYTVWSDAFQPSPAELSRSRTSYPIELTEPRTFLDVAPGVTMPPFGRARHVHTAVGRTALQVAGGARTPYAAATALERWFRLGGGFTYTDSPPSSSLADFILRTRSGYCQHFAGAMALMLRYLGIPSRVAEGFTSGTYDRQTKTWTVTDHDAHAWVEVWFPHYGWLPFDPTPGRGSLSAGYSVSSPEFRVAAAERFISGVAATLLSTASIHQDVAFGEKEPDITFRGTDIRPAKPSAGGPFGIQHRGGSLGKLLALVLALAVALLALVKAVRRHWRYATPDPRRQAAACRADLRDFLADQRIRVAPSAGPDEVAALLRRELEVDGSRFTAALAEARFAPEPDAEAAATRAREELARLREQLRRRLGVVRRARGLVSLRSLGFTG